MNTLLKKIFLLYFFCILSDLNFQVVASNLEWEFNETHNDSSYQAFANRLDDALSGTVSVGCLYATYLSFNCQTGSAVYVGSYLDGKLTDETHGVPVFSTQAHCLLPWLKDKKLNYRLKILFNTELGIEEHELDKVIVNPKYFENKSIYDVALFTTKTKPTIPACPHKFINFSETSNQFLREEVICCGFSHQLHISPSESTWLRYGIFDGKKRAIKVETSCERFITPRNQGFGLYARFGYRFSNKRPLIDYEGLTAYGISGGAVFNSAGDFIAHVGKWKNPPRSLFNKVKIFLGYYLKGFAALSRLPVPFLAPDYSKISYFIPFFYHQEWIENEIQQLQDY